MAALLSLHTISKLQANLSTSRVTVKPRAALHGAQRMRVPYELKQEQSRLFHQLPSGLNMEVIVQKGVAEKESDEKKERTSENPPLVFVHGSYHAAWCWAEHWMPFFSASGYDCYAVSLLGQGESDAPSASVAGTLQTHASDVADFICKKLTFPPVLIGHSFGGLIIQYYIANAKPDQFLDMRDFFPELTGAALVCSVPPSGNSYQELIKKSSRIPLFDLRKLNAALPVPSVPKSAIELLVLGANDDFIVDAEGLKETGRFYGVSPICVEAVAHDMMLDCLWDKGAKVILSWLKDLKK
ncbi:uncharacterized protein LOC117622167 isoform X2 [Prunus dulcis]|uniref:uncharacterized protein LOC117622167 isoform X2 n=1 Tax=Prunus dulcis TaxID=3755 RepID=UPI0014832751|nr:uncharacterized protein LOC117622167 isoform X2 [Prunus dulcis]